MQDTQTTATTATVGVEDKLPIDKLAQLDADKGLMFLGIVPLLVVGVLALVVLVLYLVRRGKNWNELGEAMRLDGDEVQQDREPQSGFTTQELSDMEPTKPSQRLRSLSGQGQSNLAPKDDTGD